MIEIVANLFVDDSGHVCYATPWCILIDHQK